ncbi:Uncharacterized protein TCM_033202 [Theobroma cacao]|uniref:Uncharacterized protein n=1 Tax=Theobroma cacao TaxID=3641 RepID=A0A061FAJ4_THECC|nr:Uncharacterized protein TCM_033202 [Theobroma cacao]
MINNLSDENRDALISLQGEIGELKAQVNLLVTAAVAKRLIDYSENSNKRKDSPSRTSSSSSNSGEKFRRVSTPLSGGSDRGPPVRDLPQLRTSKPWNFKPWPSISCFLCKEPHRVADCSY